MKMMKHMHRLPSECADSYRVRLEVAKRATMRHGREPVRETSPYSYRDGWKLDVEGV